MVLAYLSLLILKVLSLLILKFDKVIDTLVGDIKRHCIAKAVIEVHMLLTHYQQHLR